MMASQGDMRELEVAGIAVDQESWGPVLLLRDSVALAVRTGSPIFIEELVYEALVQEIPGL